MVTYSEKYLQEYVGFYHGQLVDSSHFINMFYERFGYIMSCSKEKLILDWLHSPGIPAGLEELKILQKQKCSLYIETCDSFQEFADNMQRSRKKRKIKADKPKNILRFVF